MNAAVPEGFGPIFRASPMLDALGGFMSRGAGADLEIGLLVADVHTNSRGHLHGGVAATLADTGMGYLLAFGNEPPRRLVTVSLTVDYVALAGSGDWLRVHLVGADFTGRLAFATGRLCVDERTIARIRGVYSIVNPPSPPSPSPSSPTSSSPRG